MLAFVVRLPRWGFPGAQENGPVLDIISLQINRGPDLWWDGAELRGIPAGHSGSFIRARKTFHE